MDMLLAEQFERVEKALGALVDSIAAYNPSPQAAIDLVAADDDLGHGLDQLARHQANHARIQALRAEADALDDQLKASVQKLAALRHELFDTPATTFPETARRVPVDELLQYANFISKHTVPPTYREQVPDALPDKDKDDAAAAAPTNGMNTPAHAPPSAQDNDSSSRSAAANGVAGAEMSAEESTWLQKLKESQMAWYPWPSNDKIRLGNLYKLMYYREKKYNLDEFDIPAFEDQERRKNMEGGDEPDDERPGDDHMQLVEQQQQQQQQQQLQPPPRQPRPPREAFTGFDDMDED